MKACSMPIHMVIGINSCWLGFLRCDAVAANSCKPVRSPLSPFCCFSPYLNRNKISVTYICNRSVCSEHSILRCYDVSTGKYLQVNLSVQFVTLVSQHITLRKLGVIANEARSARFSSMFAA